MANGQGAATKRPRRHSRRASPHSCCCHSEHDQQASEILPRAGNRGTESCCTPAGDGKESKESKEKDADNDAQMADASADSKQKPSQLPAVWCKVRTELINNDPRKRRVNFECSPDAVAPLKGFGIDDPDDVEFIKVGQPKILGCTKCWTEGHIRKECQGNFLLCPNCKEPHNYKDCRMSANAIKCHFCQEDHSAINCPLRQRKETLCTGAATRSATRLSRRLRWLSSNRRMPPPQLQRARRTNFSKL